MKKTEQIGELELFHNIKSETMDELMKYGKIEEFPKGTILMRAREPVGSIYIQLTGKSMVYNLTHNGRRKIMFIFGDGILLNEHVFNSKPTSVYCETMEKCKMFMIPSHIFVKVMEEDFVLTKNVLTAQEKKIWRLGHQLKNTNSGIFLERKLAAKLCKLARDFGVDKPEGREIDMNLSITFLADMLGTPRETTSRSCSILSENGLIQINKKRILIPDPERLSHFYRTGEIGGRKI